MDKKIIIGTILSTVLILIGAVWILSAQDTQATKKASTPLLGQKITDMGGIHVNRGATHTAYNSNPPTSGPHWADGTVGAGIYDTEKPDELLVHSLEHGAVILSFRSDLPKDQVVMLKNIFNQESGKIIMIPRKNLDAPVALTSWGYLLKLQSIDNAKVKAFIETNEDRGPEQAQI